MHALALTLFAAMPADVGSGVIHGGWGYVAAAYSIFWVGISLYTVSLIVRARAAKKEQQS